MINPVIFEVFGLKVHWYGLAYVLGFLFSYFYLVYFGTRSGIDKEKLEDIFLYTMIFSVLGGRVFEIVFYNLSYYISNPLKVFAVWEGGMSIHGGIFAAVLSLFYFSGKFDIDFFKLTDLFAVPASIALAFGRLANFVNQELVGKVTESSLGIVFPLHDESKRWPTTIFESAKNIVTFEVLFYLQVFRKLRSGLITAWFLILYSFGRFIIDFLREPTVSLGFISMGQLLCLVYGGAGILLLFWRLKRED